MPPTPPPAAAQKRRPGALLDAVALAAVALLLVQLLWRAELLYGEQLAPALGVTAVFAVAARVMQAVSWTGALAGFGIAFILYATAGWRMFVALFVTFALTAAATRFGRERKRELGIAEAPGGRSAAQVAANLVVAAGCMVGLAVYPDPRLVIAALAALAEAAADTVSSEIGEALDSKPFLITTLREVPPATNGGVTFGGTFSGAAAALLVASAGYALGLVPLHGLFAIAAAGFAGMLFDSVLGATLENRGWLNNEAVNLLSTFAAAGIIFLLIPGA